MIVLTCALARDFKVLLGRCMSGRPRGPAPPVVIRVRDGVRTLAATTPDGAILTHTAPAAGERDEVMVLPGAVLAEVEGGSDEPVAVERQARLRAVVRWTALEKPRSLPVDLILPGKQHELPALPELTPVGRELLTALHECGRGAARDNGRYALSKIQIQGRLGRVIGTDGKCALLWNGFTLPFPDQFLVPAVPVFGSKELARESEVRVGKSATHLIVAIGPWAVWLPIDTTSRYPDVAGIIPRTADATVAGIDEQDAQALLAALPGLPGADQENRPVTLDLDGGVTIRAADASTGVVREVYLARSPVAGSAMRVALDRTVLKRILSLACHTIRVVAGKPLIAEGDNRTVLVATLDSTVIVPPAEGAVRVSTDDAIPPTESHNPRRTIPMKPPPTNGHAPNDRHDPPTGEAPDPLDLAEELRVVLADAAARAARLVAVLRQGRKEKKVLSALLGNLKQLNLGMGGPR